MYYVYILTNWNRQVLYVGVTNDLAKRLYEHKNANADSFTGRYGVDKLVYFETTESIRAAIAREKQIKAYRRAKKIYSLKRLIPNGTTSLKKGNAKIPHP